MLKSYKVEIKPTSEQIQKIHKTIGTCRFIYNFYIAHNKQLYKESGKFVSANDFSKWLNNEFLPNNSEYSWVKNVSTKAVKQSIVNAETAFKRFFKKQSDFPKFKKKNKSNVKAYFPKNNNTDWTIERHKIKIPTLGFVRLKEFGYIPVDAKVKSGTVSYKAGHYFVSVLIEITEKDIFSNKNIISFNKRTISEGIGLDLGIKDLAVVSNNQIYKNINKTSLKIKKLEKKLKREQKSLSKKYEFKKKQIKEGVDKKQSYSNIDKNIKRIQKIHYKLSNIRQEYNKRVVNELVKTKPEFITIEDLNVSGMMKNRHLSKAIQEQCFYKFRLFLTQQCVKYGVELRIIDRWYPSSKLCSVCGSKNKDLKLSDREYKCLNSDCELHMNPIDRDLNASFNIRDCKEYKILC